MERAILSDLKTWKTKKDRKPMIIRGVRQCGKTYIIKEFGNTCFEDMAYFNFEESDTLKTVFDGDFDIPRILFELSLKHGRKICPETTLLVFDEVQLCGRALTALKYFCENAPEYPIVCAGSLLGLALHEGSSFPVGKVDFLTMYPMSYFEFAAAKGEEVLAEWLHGVQFGAPFPPVAAEKARQCLLEYYLVGGMPASVKTWCETDDLFAVEAVQRGILSSYELDFAKHAPINDFPKLRAIWRSVPEQLSRENRKFIFSQVKKGWRAKDLEDALEWLIAAGLVYKVRKIEKPFFPLSSYADDTVFKLYACDVGLLRNMAQLPYEAVMGSSPFYTEFKGAMAENFVLSEFLNAGCRDVYYWTSGNQAEVDFILQEKTCVVPAEVKAEANTRARSLSVYRNQYAPAVALKLSSVPEISGREVVKLPLYLAQRYSDFIRFSDTGA